jgi:hypothetical protein
VIPFLPLEWRQQRQVSTGLHGVTSQKTVFFILTAVRTLNLNISVLCGNSEFTDPKTFELSSLFPFHSSAWKSRQRVAPKQRKLLQDYTALHPKVKFLLKHGLAKYVRFEDVHWL